MSFFESAAARSTTGSIDPSLLRCVALIGVTRNFLLSSGTFFEGVKEEVVLSPAHALSLIAAGEESSSCGENSEGEAVNLSQLNLIDLASSESSKAETTGIRRKEGSYINKILLTLGTIILSQEKNIQRLQELVVIVSFSYLACLIASSTQT
ncbi:hypothetical protein V6Z12_A07G156400 [Gossypium hirsutum]